MKKRLLAIALALMLALTLLPVMTLEAAADDGQSLGKINQTCPKCKTEQTLEIIGYAWKIDGFQVNEKQHWLHVLCPRCKQDGYLAGEDHIGGNETPTCTTGKTCEKCHGQYGILGHDWGEWTYNGNGTHSRTCKRDAAHVETANCNGTATCQARAKCTVCGREHGEKIDHDFSVSWRSDTEQHWHYCLTKGCDARSDVGYHNINDSHYCPTCYTSPIPCMDTDNDHKCDGCGKVLTGHADTDNNHVCDLCGEVLHDLKHVPASAATSRVNGNTEYWYCEGCGKYYADAEAKTEITQASTVIPATGRRPAPTTPAASVSSPKTGDAGVALYAGMAILSLTGCAWLRRKEQ